MNRKKEFGRELAKFPAGNRTPVSLLPSPPSALDSPPDSPPAPEDDPARRRRRRRLGRASEFEQRPFSAPSRRDDQRAGSSRGTATLRERSGGRGGGVTWTHGAYSEGWRGGEGGREGKGSVELAGRALVDPEAEQQGRVGRTDETTDVRAQNEPTY